MAKRLVLALVFTMIAASAGSAWGFEIGVSGFSANSQDVSILGGGLNIASTGQLINTIGYGVFGNIMYASYKDVSVIPVDLLIGGVYRITANERLALPVAAGFYAINSFAFGKGGAARGFNIGAGGNITAELKISGNMHLYLRLQGAYGFLGGGEVFINPALGLGF